jgi:exosortase/archaeosortase family protein
MSIDSGKIEGVGAARDPVGALRSALASAIAEPSDRLILGGFFLLVFLLDYAPRAVGPNAFPTVEFVAFLAIGAVAWGMDGARRLASWDYLLVALLALAVTHPWRHVAGLALTVFGLAYSWRADYRLAALGRLALGLACVDIWGFVLHAAVEEWMLPIETDLAYYPLTLLGSFRLIGNAISHDGGHTIIVEGACSAFPNLVLTALLWLSFLKIQGLPFRPRYWAVLALGLAIIVLINTVRLGFCAWSMDSYMYWHEGTGVTILAWTMLGSLLALFYVGLRSEPEERAA